MNFLDTFGAILIALATNPIADIETQTGMRVNPQVACLAQNIYHEARNETTAGMLAVADVTMNRVEAEEFPNTVCEVVYEAPHYVSKKDGKRYPYRHRCQFSWYCDGKPDTVNNTKKYQAIYILSLYAMESKMDLTDGALFYHADYVNPTWAERMKITAKIDTHIFYIPMD